MSDPNTRHLFVMLIERVSDARNESEPLINRHNKVCVEMIPLQFVPNPFKRVAR